MEILESTHPSLIWITVGILLFIIEFFSPGLIALFFAIAAGSVAVAVWISPLNFLTQILLFSGLSILYLLTIRRRWKGYFQGLTSGESETDETRSEYLGKTVEVTKEITPPLSGKVLFKGAEWEAHADIEIAKGSQVQIIGIQGIQFKVQHLSNPKES